MARNSNKNVNGYFKNKERNINCIQRKHCDGTMP